MNKKYTWLALVTALFFGSCSPTAGTALSDPTLDETLPLLETASDNDPGSDQFSLLMSFSAHQGRVLDLAFSAGGDYLASSGQDKEIKLWNPTNGEAFYSFPMNSVDMADIDISLQENLLASGEAIWDIGNLQEVLTLERGSAIPAFVAFSPDGLTLALASLDDDTRLWDLTSGESVFSFPAQEEKRTKRMAFSPDGTLLVEGVMDGSIRIWDVKEGELIRSLHNNGETDIHDISISPDGMYLANVGRQPWVIVWDLSSGEVIQRFRTRDNMNGVAFSADGRILAASAGAEDAVLLWDLESGDPLGSLPLSDQAQALDFSPDGRWLAAGTFGGKIFIWSLSPQ